MRIFNNEDDRWSKVSKISSSGNRNFNRDENSNSNREEKNPNQLRIERRLSKKGRRFDQSI